MDLLEIPQLIDTFIRTSHYEDAMDLAAHVSRLHSRYPNLSIITEIYQQVQKSCESMISQLIGLLRGNVKLPLCIRIIGYLRRMEVCSEEMLRFMFLRERDVYLSKVLASISMSPISSTTALGISTSPTETTNPQTMKSSNIEHHHKTNNNNMMLTILDASDYVKRYIEISREIFFDIITQYRAIFSDVNTSIPISLLMDSNPFQPPLAYKTFSHLTSYVTMRMIHLRDMLKKELPKIQDTTLLSSLLTQLMYYGMSLGRVGIDFRGTILSIFESVIEDKIVIQLNEITDGFDASCQGGDFNSSSSSSTTNTTTNTTTKQHPSSLTSSTIPTTGISSQQYQQYQHQLQHHMTDLLKYPLFAYVLNEYFKMYNDLRGLAPLSLEKKLSLKLESSLIQLSQSLKKFVLSNTMGLVKKGKGGRGGEEREERGNSYDNERRQVIRIFKESLIPLILNGWELIWGLIPGQSDIDINKIVEGLQ